MRLLNLFYQDQGNVGDMMCRSLMWFREPHWTVEYGDIRRWRKHGIKNYDAVVVGGGGLVNEEHMPHIWDMSQEAKKLVIWGIGPNDRNARETNVRLPKIIGGVRIKGVPGFDFVPCASCMSPEFDNPKKYPMVRRIAVAGHPWFSKKYNGELHNGVKFDHVIRFLASTKRVVTNSYHFAYWGILMKKEVVICDAWSSKFYNFPWDVPIVWNYRDAQTAECRTYPDALAEARRLNIQFYNRMKKEIEGKK